jgi:hypothetical protein
VEIRINSHLALTIKESSRAHRTLVRGWPEHYPNVIREVQWGVI